MILLALGSNLGEREAQLTAACAALEAHDVNVMRRSSLHETPALIPEGAPEDWNIPYLNQVIEVETHLSPHELLICLKHIEQDLGRQPRERWAPREIDLDIIAYGDEVVVDEMLTLPHPQMDGRRFVLEPLTEIAPAWRHPVFHKTATEMLKELGV